MLRFFFPILLAVLATACSSVVRASETERPPNVVFVLADDLGYGELGCYGQDKIRTPTLDRLASQGIRLTDHHSGSPVCAPARCTLMTGMHGGHAPIRTNRDSGNGRVFPGQWPIKENVVTVAEVLSEAGYTTGGFGKWGLGPTDTSGSPIRQGFDRFFGYNCQRLAHSYYPIYLDDDERQVMLNPFAIPGHHRKPDGPVDADEYRSRAYAPDRIIREATKFIDDHHEEPFFLYVPLIEPHVAMQPPQKWIETYPQEWDDEVGPYRGDNGYLPHPRPRSAYAAMISDMDEHVDIILKRLARHGIDDNTLVIFTSDNGPTHGARNPNFHVGGAACTFFDSNGPHRGFKGSVYEGGLRVPAIVRWPGRIPVGTTGNAPSYFPDWFATICAATGAQLPTSQPVDGENLLPHLTSGGEVALEREKPMIWNFNGYGGQLAVRDRSWKAVRLDVLRKQPKAWELYNLSDDPSEANDVASSNPEIVEQLERQFIADREPEPDFPMPLYDGQANKSTPEKGRASLPRPEHENKPGPFSKPGSSSKLVSREVEKPNVLIMMIDDWGWRDAACLGSDFYETPNIDALAESGLTFTNAYAAAANCAPSRASFLTGTYTPRHRIFNVGTSRRGKAKHGRLMHIPGTDTLDPSMPTIGDLAKEQGYRTASMGKWHVSENPLDHGFELNVAGDHRGSPPKGYFPPHPNAVGLEDTPEGEYLTKTLTDRAERFIRDNQGQSWLLYLSHFAVHTPLQAPKGVVKKYENRQSGELHNHPTMAAMVEYVDRSVGRMMETLNDCGILENTIIILTSDNGGYGPATSMRPLRGSKGMYYEGGIRVPLIVSWPARVKSHGTCNAVVHGVDMLATIGDLVGTTTELETDGQSLYSLIQNPEKTQVFDQRSVFWHFPAYLQAYSRNMEDARDRLYRSRPCGVVRSGDRKLIEYFEDGAIEVFDLENDLGERVDLSSKAKEVMAVLHEDLDQWQALTKAPIPMEPNPRYDPRADP
ncbi:MAG: sulfatase-like hydrolase/transferase [Planctomycetota bacterium]